jgi:molybdopterin-guanine dinucleotide biosynthesis protein MobB
MPPPTLAISGWSGAGKTTVIESLIPRLVRRGLRVGVLKHDAHRLAFDRPGKDTWRVREAGAARVEAYDESWWFQIAPTPPGSIGAPHPRAFRQDLDILLVEGGKDGGWDKIWIVGPDGRGPPDGTGAVILSLERGPGAVEAVEEKLIAWLEARWRDRPRAAVVLAGSSPGPFTCVASSFTGTVLAGVRPVPGLHGPGGELIAALRWAPELTWIALDARGSCPGPELLEWLWSQRRPGIWAVVPEAGGVPDPFRAIYEPQAAHVLEEAAALGARELARVLADHPCTAVVSPPGAGAR